MPRSRNPEAEKNVTLSIRLPVSIYEEIQEKAASEERSMNWMISSLLRQALENMKKEHQSGA
jgi:hypothetical protein